MGLFGRKAQNEDTFTSFDAAAEEVHTIHNPYCSDINCWCHTNVAYHDQVQHRQPTDQQIEEVYNFFSIPRRGR